MGITEIIMAANETVSGETLFKMSLGKPPTFVGKDDSLITFIK